MLPACSSEPSAWGWKQFALALWVLMVVVVSVRVFLAPEKASVLPIYIEGATDWLAGRDPYFSRVDRLPPAAREQAKARIQERLRHGTPMAVGDGSGAYRYGPPITPLLVP